MAIAVAGSAAAQGTLIYAPVKLIKDQGISVKGWGSGTVSETDETAYEGTHSIRISSRNFFQGGIISFGSGVDLSKEFQDPSNLLRITYKLADGSVAGGPGGAPGGGLRGPGAGPGGGGGKGGGAAGGGGGGGVGGAAGGAVGGGGTRGGGTQGGPPNGPPGGFPGGPGGPPGGFPGAQGGRPGGMLGGGGGAGSVSLETMRMIITTTDGKKSEAYVPTESAMSGDRGWLNIAIPLKAISGFDKTNMVVKSIALAPDTTSTFFVGEMRVVGDTTPIRAEVTPAALNLGVNQEVKFSAVGLGGASILKYEWDFDDADGIQVDATGRTVTRRFRKPGNYTITLTVSDYFGLKKPYTTTIKATVNP